MIVLSGLKKRYDTRKLIKEGYFADAFANMLKNAVEAHDYTLENEVKALEQNYKYMLKYVASGGDDPHRDEVYSSLKAKMYALHDSIVRAIEIKSSSRLFYTTLRNEQQSRHTLEMLLEQYHEAVKCVAVAEETIDGKVDDAELLSLKRRKENCAISVFHHIWTAYPLTDTLTSQIKAIVDNNEETRELKELAVAAIMLHLTEIYDERLLCILLDVYLSTGDTSLRIKALCSAMLILCSNIDKATKSSDIINRLKVLTAEESSQDDIIMITQQFILSRTTEQVSRKIKEDLVPKLMKITPDLRNKIKDFNPEDPEEQALNPQWQEMLDKEGITDKMMELSRMQAEGKDIYISSFSQLKTFPFFMEIANWFLPFSIDHSTISNSLRSIGKPLFEVINSSGSFCDNDKYSFALSLDSMPEGQRTMMLSRFDAENTQIAEEYVSQLPDPAKERKLIANKYLQNLYRFFHLFRFKHEFKNPLLLTFNTVKIPVVCDIFKTANHIKVLAESFFKFGFYSEAAEAYCVLMTLEPNTAEHMQKCGYCYESLEQYENAVSYYEKADLIKTDDVWTLKHLAASWRAMDENDKAIAVYKRLEKLDADNPAVCRNIAACLLAANRPAEALKYYHKVDYIAANGVKSKRPIAWCELLLGNFERSIEVYRQIIAASAKVDDVINLAHALLCSGDVAAAIEEYRRAAAMSSVDNVHDTLCIDSALLLRLNVDQSLLSLICDILVYGQEAL